MIRAVPSSTSKASLTNRLLNSRISSGVANFEFGKEANHYVYGVGKLVIIDKKFLSVSKSDRVSVGDALKTLLTDIEVGWGFPLEVGESRYDFDGMANTLTRLRYYLGTEGLSRVTKESLVLTSGVEIKFGRPRLDLRYKEDSGESTGVHGIYQVRMDSHPLVAGDLTLEMVCLFAYIFGKNLR